MNELAAAYSATGAAWGDGPARVYGRMAEVLVERCPGGVAGRTVLDLGAGSGVAGAAALAAGAARVVAVDVAPGMLAHGRAGRPPAVAGDLLAVPLGASTVGAVVAAFSLNHVADAAAGLREAARVLRPGGGLVAGAYAADDGHPVRAAVADAAYAWGWRPPPWYRWVQERAVPALATVDGARAALAAAALDGNAEQIRVPLDDLTPGDLVAWRLGMAQLAPFVATLGPDERAALVADALDRLGPASPRLVRSLVVLTART